MPHRENVLVVFARLPRPGSVKTRLLPAFTAEEACAVHRALAGDVVDRAARLLSGVADVVLAWSGPPGPADVLDDLPAGVAVEVQSGNDLGERMALALQSKLRAGYRRAVILGSDSPTLPADHLTAAFDLLESADVVLGPADDGGYYLVGMSHLHLEIFRGIAWGSAGVLKATRERLRKSGARSRELGMWHDVDTAEDVARLWKDLIKMKERGAADLPARSYRTLARLAPGRLHT